MHDGVGLAEHIAVVDAKRNVFCEHELDSESVGNGVEIIGALALGHSEPVASGFSDDDRIDDGLPFAVAVVEHDRPHYALAHCERVQHADGAALDIDERLSELVRDDVWLGV